MRTPIFSLLASTLLGMPLLAAPPQLTTQLPCVRVELEPAERPRWISSAVWSPESNKAIVVDPYQNKLLTYALDGSKEDLPNPRIGLVQFFPANLQRIGDRFLLKLLKNDYYWLDTDFRGLAQASSLLPKSMERSVLTSTYQWTVADDKLVAFGSLAVPGKDPRLGFVRAPLQDLSKPELLKWFDDNSYYVLGHSYLTTLGESAFLLQMSERPVILEVPPRGSVRVLKDFPEEFLRRPSFKTQMTGPSSATAHFAELETFAVAVGLYSSGGNLFLLTRNPSEKGTDWLLFKMEMSTRKFGGPMKLPTHSNHLTVVPAQGEWIVFERGAVGESQRQTIPSFLRILTSAIDEGTLPDFCPTQER